MSSLLPFLILAMAFISKALTTDHSSLLSLKSHINLSRHHILAKNWSTNASVCDWIGVVCGSRYQRVIALDISSMGLVGTLPSQLGNLSFLVSLNMSHNHFYGNLPRELANLRRLKILNLGFNDLNGDIPRDLSACSELEELSLVYNNFVGMIPREIGNLNMLQFLLLGRNNLEGVIPREIGNLKRLEKLEVEHNLFIGTIPESIFNISSLTIIGVENNSLSGTLPSNMCLHLQKLESLYLSKNKLYGNIPTSIGDCASLKELYAWGNQFSGFFPRRIGNLTMLQRLDLGVNALSGEIPKELGNLNNLEDLRLDHNGLSGSIPWEIFNISTLRGMSVASNYNLSGTLPSSVGPNLEFLYLSGNNIGGLIPAQISNASNLVVLELSQNHFTGFIPNSLGNLAQLKILNLMSNNLTTDPKFSLINALVNCRYIQELDLSSNPLNTVLPSSIGNLSTTLQMFLAEDCNIRGQIPHEIGNLSNLYVLALSINEIIGSLPMTMQALQNLQRLYVTQNRLKGSFPDVVCKLRNLGLISLERNEFSGPISGCLGNVSSLREIYLPENEFIVFPPTLWSLQNLLRLDLHSNNLRGSIPREIGNAKTAILIDLSHNKLSGEIPSTIGGLTALMNFSVAHNTIKGSIPDTFGKLMDLHSLDLSDNNFSGIIPKSLEGLISMNYFNVSHNRLTGEIPSGGPFANFTYESFLTNDGLCGTPRMHVPPCPANTPRIHQSKKNKVALIVLVSLAVIVLLIASVTVYLILKRRRKELPSEPDLLSAITQGRFSYYELQRATNGFDDNNLLGSGSFGSVYKGTLTNGMHVATKVFHLLHEGENKSFDTECEVLRNIRHRNLTKVLGSCSNLDFKALVLEYMPNGSLHKWLYSHNYFLNIIQRLSIMIDVAYALEYLHFGYSEPVIHCDLKPNNVLIDADMVGHLSDFGTAKLLGDENSIAFTNSLATIGYIAPEYGQEGLVSTRSDMYSYGIMLLEVFTRTQPGDEMFNEDLSLRSWVQNAFSTEIGHVIDPNLLGLDEEKYDEKLQCVVAIFELGMKCSTESPRERMAIKDALRALEKIKVKFLSLYART